VLRAATPADAAALAMLAVQVFLDTYATEGVRADLAEEALAEYSVAAFARRLAEPQRRWVLAEHPGPAGEPAAGPGLLGFAECLAAPQPLPEGLAWPAAPGQPALTQGGELVRLYLQPRWQRQGLGRQLLRAAEQAVVVQAEAGGVAAPGQAAALLWLTAWDGNQRALAFYAAQGYRELGGTWYSFGGRRYGNRVLARRLG